MERRSSARQMILVLTCSLFNEVKHISADGLDLPSCIYVCVSPAKGIYQTCGPKPKRVEVTKVKMSKLRCSTSKQSTWSNSAVIIQEIKNKSVVAIWQFNTANQKAKACT